MYATKTELMDSQFIHHSFDRNFSMPLEAADQPPHGSPDWVFPVRLATRRCSVPSFYDVLIPREAAAPLVASPWPLFPGWTETNARLLIAFA